MGLSGPLVRVKPYTVDDRPGWQSRGTSNKCPEVPLPIQNTETNRKTKIMAIRAKISSDF